MKKVLSFGLTGLLMLGTVSQASAAFEAGNLILSVFDKVSGNEIGVDLGKNLDFSKTQVIKSGLDFSGLNRDNGHIAIWSDNFYETAGVAGSKIKWYDGFIATGSNTGVTLASGLSAGIAFHGADTGIRGLYGADADGVANVKIDHASSYYKKMSLEDSVYYSGLYLPPVNTALLPTAGTTVDLYLYQFKTLSTSPRSIKEVSDNHVGIIRLSADGTISTYAPPANPVPVPGAAWLLGSSLIGLAGLRRRKNI